MKNYKRQEESGACGLYNLANALREEGILVYDGEDDYVPCGDSEVNKILRVEDIPLVLKNIATSLDWRIPIPNEFLSESITSFVNSEDFKRAVDYHLLTFIAYVQMGETEFDLHAVTLMYCNGKFAYSDPRDEGFVMLDSLSDFFTKFKYINSFNTFGTEDGFTCFDGEKNNETYEFFIKEK